MQPGNFPRAGGDAVVSDLIEQGGRTDGRRGEGAAGRADDGAGGGAVGCAGAERDQRDYGDDGERTLREREATACIRCSRCVDACPIGIGADADCACDQGACSMDLAMEYDLLACVECGCCTYVCPARIPLLQYLRSWEGDARWNMKNRQYRD